MPAPRASRLARSITIQELESDPHPVLARLREQEPVVWVPALEGWLVTRHDLALQVMLDPARFTVDDPRFSTARVIGPSMLSLDGPEHGRHRAPFVAPFRAGAVQERFASAAAAESLAIIERLAPGGRAELRRAFAGPLAAAIVARALGLGEDETSSVLDWYEAIVSGVTEITAHRGEGDAGKRAFAQLAVRLQQVIDGADHACLLAAAARGSQLTHAQVVSNAAVLLFGGIETTEGMIANLILHLLEDPDRREAVRRDPQALDRAIDESLRLEPAAAVVDRYATADSELGSAQIARHELVRVSISAANRDPAMFERPDHFDLGRENSRRHLAFAHGPHVCVGVHLARLETRTGVRTLLDRFPELRLDPEQPAAIRGLVFRKPPTLHVVWN